MAVLTACGNGGDANGDDEPTAASPPEGLQALDAWIRPAVLPQGSPTPDPDHEHESERGSGVISALYFTIENHGDQSAQLVGVESEIARVAELHETRDEDGLMRMRRVESVDVPAGGEVVFEPGGFHVMLIDINRPLEPGDEVAVTLIFSSGERLELSPVPVQDS